MVNESPEVAVIGAGPYGLSIAAHLRHRSVSFRIFGHAMQTWLTRMPVGMMLKSDGFASNLSDPEARFTLRAYCEEQGIPYKDQDQPVRLETFCAYGLAFQRRLVPTLEERIVVSIARGAKGFELRLDNGQTVTPQRVVIAVGLGAFQNVPTQLAHLPAEVFSHSSHDRDLASFRGRDVTVVGGGASALDLAALLHAQGAVTRIICRQAKIEIHQGPGLKSRSLWQGLRHPRSGIGHSLRSFVLAEAPLLFHCLPEQLRLRIVRTHLGPAGGWFVRDLVIGKVPFLLGCTITEAERCEGFVRLKIRADDSCESFATTDHVIAATGYRVDLRRLAFLDAGIVAQLQTAEHSPVLSRNFESSVPGLYFVGALSASSFGPLVRFAFGARFTAGRLAKHLYKRSRQPALYWPETSTG